MSMIFKQTYRPGFMNVVLDSDKKVLCNKSGNPQSDKCPTMEFLFPFLEMNNCRTSVANRRKEGCNTLPFAWKTKNAQNAVFMQKISLYHKLAFCDTKRVSHEIMLLARSVFVIHKKLRSKKKFLVSRRDTK